VTARLPVPTLGVEVELQVLDAATGASVSRAPEVLEAAERRSPGDLHPELALSQVEFSTPVCATLGEADASLRRLRRLALDAAAEAGCALASCGTPPLADLATQAVSTGPRYDPILSGFGMLAREQLVAGLHVHVGLDASLRVAASDHSRPWLPVLTALTGSSPYWLGVDTGFASYRTVHWGRWPVSGTPPRFRDASGYDAVVAGLLASRVVPDATKLYWDLRPSHRHPTLEYRVCDALHTHDEAVVVAGLVRALAVTAAWAHLAGEPATAPPDELVRAARNEAARDGLGGDLLDPHTALPRPAVEVVEVLLDHVRPALEAAGDTAVVTEGVRGLLSRGTGADRQRAAARRGGPAAAVRLVVEETAQGV
jgi:carboxylate-amine ligase